MPKTSAIKTFIVQAEPARPAPSVDQAAIDAAVKVEADARKLEDEAVRDALTSYGGLILGAKDEVAAEAAARAAAITDLQAKLDAANALITDMQGTAVTVDGKVANIENAYGTLIDGINAALAALTTRVSDIEAALG